MTIRAKEAVVVMIGVDAHKRSHTFVAADEVGRELATKTVPATTDGNLVGVAWARQWSTRTWALEDCRHLTRRLEADLLRSGEAVLRVPTRLMADARRGGREPGKSDPIDALAVARAALREPDLPVAHLDGPARRVRLLVDHREDLVTERTRIQCRLRWHLHELAPELDVPAKALRRMVVLQRVREQLAGLPVAGDAALVAAIAMELVDRCVELTRRANDLEKQIKELVTELAPTLLRIPGCGVLSAAKILGETAGVERFRSKDAYARFNGTAPIPVWSGKDDHRRLSRGGNRQVNAALHRIAITQLRLDGAGHDYVARLTTAGKTRTEAIRLLRRRLSDVVFRSLHADRAAATSSTQRLAAAA